MSVLHLHTARGLGGAGRVVQLLAAGQQSAGMDVTVAATVATGDDPGPFLRPLERAGVRVQRWAIPARRYDLEHAQVTRLCRSLRPHVVHTHSYRADVVGGRAARRLGIPVVTTVHGFIGGGWRNRIYETVQRRSFHRFDAVVAVSRPLADELSRDGIPGDRIHLVPNAYPESLPRLDPAAARERLGVAPGVVHLGWVGRVTREKGPDVMVEAMRHLDHLPLVLSVIGDGRERPALEARVVALGLADRVRWHGTMTDAGSLFPAFDLFILSSHTEGTPMVLFEAMAAGVPIVATAVGGVPDVVSEDEALVVPAGDPAALAAAIRRALSDRDGALLRAYAATRRLRREFSSAAWVRRYGDIYGSIAGGRA